MSKMSVEQWLKRNGKSFAAKGSTAQCLCNFMRAFGNILHIITLISVVHQAVSTIFVELLRRKSQFCKDVFHLGIHNNTWAIYSPVNHKCSVTAPKRSMHNVYSYSTLQSTQLLPQCTERVVELHHCGGHRSRGVHRGVSCRRGAP